MLDKWCAEFDFRCLKLIHHTCPIVVPSMYSVRTNGTSGLRPWPTVSIIEYFVNWLHCGRFRTSHTPAPFGQGSVWASFQLVAPRRESRRRSCPCPESAPSTCRGNSETPTTCVRYLCAYLSCALSFGMLLVMDGDIAATKFTIFSGRQAALYQIMHCWFLSSVRSLSHELRIQIFPCVLNVRFTEPQSGFKVTSCTFQGQRIGQMAFFQVDTIAQYFRNALTVYPVGHQKCSPMRESSISSRF